jgi:hypothetical protein
MVRDPRSSFYGYGGGGSVAGYLVDALGRTIPRTDDPAFQPPAAPDANAMRAGVTVIRREVPIITTNTSWTPQGVRDAIGSMVIGLFQDCSQLSDTIMSDSRVSATLASRTGGLLGRPVTHTIPKGLEDDEDAKKAHRVWTKNWDRIFPESVASEFLRWTLMQSFGLAQNIWDTTGKHWIPEPSVWHPLYTYYHWLYRCYVAITQDGQVPVTPGDGSWILHAPHGAYRGWMRGSVWSIAPWWLSRNYALRDWSRYSERHGMPMILAMTPAASDPAQSSQFKQAMSTLGQDTVVQLPQGVEPQYSYGLELLEATDQGWQGFHQLIEQCNTEITLAIMGQNLTTEVKEGSFAAARVHADVRQTLLEADARALERTIREQIAKPFAMVNWGRPEIAPVTKWNLDPYEDSHTMAQTFQAFATAYAAMRKSGKEIQNIEKLAEDFGLRLHLGDITDVPPISGGLGGK